MVFFWLGCGARLPRPPACIFEYGGCPMVREWGWYRCIRTGRWREWAQGMDYMWGWGWWTLLGDGDLVSEGRHGKLGSARQRVLVFTLDLWPAAAAAKSLQSCPTLCDPRDGSPPGSPHPWDPPGKNTGVGCHCLLRLVTYKAANHTLVWDLHGTAERL